MVRYSRNLLILDNVNPSNILEQKNIPLEIKGKENVQISIFLHCKL